MVIAFQSRGIVGRLIAKNLAEPPEPGGIGHEPVPVIVRHFMTEVCGQGAQRLVQADPPAFALDRVRLGNVKCYNSVFMSGEKRRGARHIANETEA